MSEPRWVLKIVERADGTPSPEEGQYILACDFDGNWGMGEFYYTSTQALAISFPSPAAAMAYWKTVSATVPTRPDGKPNRPLTAYTVEVERVSPAGGG